MDVLNSTFSSAPSTCTKFLAYDPAAHQNKSRSQHKPKAKPKAKPRAATRVAERNLFEPDSSGEGGDWWDIDDFPMPETVGDLHIVPFSEKLEQNQRAQELLDEREMNQIAPTLNMDVELGINAVPYGSRALPLTVDDDEADDSSSRLLNDHSQGYDMGVGKGKHHSGQHGDLNAASIQAAFTEDTNRIQRSECFKIPEVLIIDVFEEDLTPDDTYSSDFGVGNGVSATSKRARRSSTDATPPMETADLTEESELGCTRPAKKQRQSHTLEPASPTESAQPIAIDEPIPSLPDSDEQSVATKTSESHLIDLFDEENGNSDVYDSEAGEPLLQSKRQANSPLGTEGRYIGPDSSRRRDTNNSDSSSVGEAHEGDVNPTDSALYRDSVESSQRHKLSNCPARTKRHNLSQIGPRAQHKRLTSTPTLGRVPPPESHHLSRTKLRRGTRSGCSQTLVRTSAGNESNSNHRPNVSASHRVSDVSIHPIPKSSSIVTAIIHCNEPKPMPHLAVCSPGILGEKEQVIRTVQVSPDSWLLIGYRNNDDKPCLATRESFRKHKDDQKSYTRMDSANNDSDHVDDSETESGEDEDEEGSIRCRRRTNMPWSELENHQLRAYVGMAMKWKEIARRFPERTPSAVQQRLYALRRRSPSRR
ncbi:hypothetical protein B0J11DRAFT_512128 [Dendryphion nanum]|uniref:Myb-like domain-containing protein n=1 Tax=Dendryphion nanum TaxID=256645 RepID=A0A9P9D2K2_9PLEO|nr:hypothetical protein B0J11DRAFT_512128 [Dendryphion nanum]